jgi:hypothetical protein
MKHTFPHTPQQNGAAERNNCTLKEMDNCMIQSPLGTNSAKICGQIHWVWRTYLVYEVSHPNWEIIRAMAL